MTSAVNVRSQLIHSVIFIFISLCSQCDAATAPGPLGRVLDKYFIGCVQTASGQ